MKKRILAFALTLAMVVTSLSMLSFVSFAEDAPVDDDANEEIATVLLAGYTAKEAVNVTSSATATATYSLASGNIVINVNAADLASVEANIGGYETTATATEGAATITAALKNVVVYKDGTGNAVADLQLVVTTATEETFNGTLVFVTNDSNVVVNTQMNTSGVNGAGKGGNVGEANFGKVIYTQAEGGSRIEDSYLVSHGESFGKNPTRLFSFDITVSDMSPVAKENISYVTGGGDANTYDKIFLEIGSNMETPGAILFNIVNTTNGGSNGETSLVLVYRNLLSNRTEIISLDKTVGEKVHIEVFWDVTYNTNYGYIKVDDKVLYESDEIRTLANYTNITSSITSGVYLRMKRGTTTGTAAFNFAMENMTLVTKTHAHTADRILAASANSNAVVSEGAIKLSYVQETTPMNAITATELSADPLCGYGGSKVGRNVLSVNNTAARAYSQGNFSVLAHNANRYINFTLNVDNLNAYDFSNGGTLNGAAKYVNNIDATNGHNQGLGTDLTPSAFDKLIVGASTYIADGTHNYACMLMWVVRDTTDGLVLVHTNYAGAETVIVIGDKMSQDIAINIVWNKNNTGSIKVDTADAVALADCTTDRAYIANSSDTGTQCGFGGYGTVANGYFGINSVWSTNNASEGYVAPNATVTLGTTTVEMPLDVRFIATIDTLDAKVAGFDINLKGSEKVVTKTTDTAYNAISADDDLEKIMAPDGSYFVAVTINGVPTTGTVTFVVRPFYTYGAETIYGAAYEVTYTNGAFVSAVAAE